MSKLTLPWPPSANKRMGVFRGKMILSREARAWYAEASDAVAEQRPKTVTGPIHIRIYLYPPSKRKYDPDNKIKILLDCLVKNNLIEDDNNSIIKSLVVHSCEIDEEKEGLAIIKFYSCSVDKD